MITRILILVGLISVTCEFFSDMQCFYPKSPVSTVTRNTQLNHYPNSPIPTATNTVVRSFKLTEPKVNATLIVGTGTPNVPIKIYEVAQTADLLGQVTISATGSFIVSFPNRPL